MERTFLPNFSERVAAIRRQAMRREAAGILLWAATVVVVYGTLPLPFWLHLFLTFVWLIVSGLVFIAFSRRNQRDMQSVYRESLDQVSSAHSDILMQMATYSEARDAFTGEHLQRVRKIAIALATNLGLPPDEAESIGRAAVAHDLGKIGVPDAILGKPAKLTEDEYSLMKTHTIIGEHVLGDSPLFELERQSARHHHEWWNGEGYPDGLSGEDIPLVARITAVADVFDALITRRPYKDPWPLERAFLYLKERSGTQFDPKIIDAFIHLFEAGTLPLPPAVRINADNPPPHREPPKSPSSAHITNGH